MSSLALISDLTPSRTTSWSSTSKTRMRLSGIATMPALVAVARRRAEGPSLRGLLTLRRKNDEKRRSLAGTARDVQGPSQPGRPIAHVGYAVPAQSVSRSETDTVVLD